VKVSAVSTNPTVDHRQTILKSMEKTACVVMLLGNVLEFWNLFIAGLLSDASLAMRLRWQHGTSSVRSREGVLKSSEGFPLFVNCDGRYDLTLVTAGFIVVIASSEPVLCLIA
jgi:hypothetical protein